MSTCQFCQRVFENKRGLASHGRWCKGEKPVAPIAAAPELIIAAEPQAQPENVILDIVMPHVGAKSPEPCLEADDKDDVERLSLEFTGKGQMEKVKKAMTEHSLEMKHVIILQLEYLDSEYVHRDYHLFTALADAYAWFAQYANDPRYAIHSVFLPGHRIKAVFDIDIPILPDTPPHGEVIQEIISAFNRVIIEDFKGVDQAKMAAYRFSMCKREKKVGAHIRFPALYVDSKDAHQALCIKVMEGLPDRLKGQVIKGVFVPFVDSIPGVSLRMPGTYKKDKADGSKHLLVDHTDKAMTEYEKMAVFRDNLITEFDKGVELTLLPYKTSPKPTPIVDRAELSDNAQAVAREFMRRDYPAYADAPFNGYRFLVRAPNFCLVCNKEHTNRPSFIVLHEDGSLYAKCWIDTSKSFCMRGSSALAEASAMVEPSPVAAEPMEMAMPVAAAAIPYEGTSYDLCLYVKHEVQDDKKLKEILANNFVMIHNNSDQFLVSRNRMDGVIRWKQLPTLNPTATNPRIMIGGKLRPLNKYYADEKLGYANMKKTMSFEPFLAVDDTPHDTLNLFGGFKFPYEKREYKLDDDGIPVPPDCIKHWIFHITNVLCMEDELIPTESCQHLGLTLLRWFGMLVQHPKAKTWCPVHKSIEGSGKTVFYGMISRMIGKGYMSTFTSFDQICGDFNGDMANRLLFVLDEATNYPTQKQREEMKNLIANKTLRINEKFEKPYESTNYAKVVITTNNPRPVVIDHTDRRYGCFRCNNEYVGNDRYFAPLVAGQDDEEQQRELFLYFANIDVSGFVNRPPHTKWSEQLVSSNIQPHIDFVADWITKHPEGIPHITLPDLHAKYQAYLTQTSGAKPLGPNIFLNSMKEDLGADYKQCRRLQDGESVKARWILFDTEKLIAELTKRGAL